jgi:methionine synthase II (cobalamin-independent)
VSKFAGAQLSGRFAWPADLIDAARKYTREKTAENTKSLEAARRKAAKEIVQLQANLGLEYVTDGGVGFLDIFTPYAGGVEGVGSGGNIDKYPGTRNSYYHTPVVRKALKGGSEIEKDLFTKEIWGGKKKAILPSPASLALASENSYYSNLEELTAAYAKVLREDARRLEKDGYDLVQLTECFLPVGRFSKRVRKSFVGAFAESVDFVFKGFGKRSCVYFHAGDASALIPSVLKTAVTDVGFDFNTPPQAVSTRRIDKNVVMGLQNTTRKLPDDWLGKEPEALVARAKAYAKNLRLGKDKEVSLCPSQDYDGLQTYPQARRRLEGLAKASSALGGRWQ